MKRQSFTAKYDGTGRRYGELFVAVRELPCHLCALGYAGPGHEPEGRLLGAQGGPTAHHTGYYDSDGLIPCCGPAHDLFAGLGGRKAIGHFRDWLEKAEAQPWKHAIETIGHRYIQRVRGIED